MMNFLWERGATSASDLHTALAKKEPLAYTTIHTELSRLLEKRLVAKVGRNAETKYVPAMTREVYLERRVSQTLEELIDTHGAAAMHGFVEVLAQDEAMLRQLQRVLEQRKK